MKGQTTAFAYYRTGKLQQAEHEARAALESCDQPGLRHLLGILLCRRGCLEEGAVELARALDLAPANAAIRVSYVRSLIDLGRAEEALRHARRPAPGFAAADLWKLRAEAAHAAGELGDQIEALHNVDL